MTDGSYRHQLTAAPLTLLLVLFGLTWNGTIADQVMSAQSQSLFVALADADGVPITDLGPQDVVIEMDGEHSETINIEMTKYPARVTIFVDNGVASVTGLADMREGINLFLDEIDPDIEVAVATTGGRPQFWSEHTTDRVEGKSAVGKIAPQPIDAAKFVDALYEEAERYHEDEEGQYLPVIVNVSTNGPEQSGQARQGPFREMIQRMFEAKATIHTLLFQDPRAGSDGGLQERWGQDLAAGSGGVFQSMISSNGYRNLLPQLAADINRRHRLVNNQYRVDYVPPDGISEQPAIRILTTRADASIFATLDGNVQIDYSFDAE